MLWLRKMKVMVIINTLFFFRYDSFLYYGEGEGLKRSWGNPEGTKPPPDQTGALRTRLDFLNKATFNCGKLVGGKVHQVLMH